MPTYGYRCSRGHHFELRQRITDPPVDTCPECGSPATRVFYPVGIIFKGQGFYKTDSRGSEAASAPAPASETKPEATKSEPAKPKPKKPAGRPADSKSSDAKEAAGS